MYPVGYSTYIKEITLVIFYVENIERITFWVLTIVLKLFLIVQPYAAFWRKRLSAIVSY